MDASNVASFYVMYYILMARTLKNYKNFIKVTSDFDFTVTSWFLGNVRLKPYFNTQCSPIPPIFRPAYGPVEYMYLVSTMSFSIVSMLCSRALILAMAFSTRSLNLSASKSWPFSSRLPATKLESFWLNFFCSSMQDSLLDSHWAYTSFIFSCSRLRVSYLAFRYSIY